MDLTKQFFKYVSQNIFGLLGTSCYILADTYFIAQAAGTDGVTLLNLCLPIYNFIFAIGSMIALGSATRYAIAKAQNDARGQRYFSNAILCAVLASIPWMLAGVFAPGALLRLMGGDAGIVALGIPYARIFLLFTPFFMCNYIVSAFVRNDGDPSLAMVATLSGSLFNVVFDYIFMFPLGLGLAGAALATAVSPIISIAICSRHFLKKENTLQFVRQMPSVRLLGQSCQLGISGFVGELSSGVTTTVFNFLLLGLAGNVGVAAYGVVANFALVATAIFNGVAQGAQPLVSRCYGQNDHAGARKLLLLGSGTVLVLAAVLYAAVFGLTDTLVSWFNSENSVQMAQYAHTGMRMYFVGYFFAGFNIMAAGFLMPMDPPARASRGPACARAPSAGHTVTAAAPPGYPPAERALPPAAPDIPPAARPPRDFPAGRAGGSTGRAAGFPPHSTRCRSIVPGRSCPPSGNSAPGIARPLHRSSPGAKKKPPSYVPPSSLSTMLTSPL